MMQERPDSSAGQSPDRRAGCSLRQVLITRECSASPRKPSAKLISLDQAAAIIENAHAESKRVAFTNGCFDLLHVGHVGLLCQAREHGDMLIVALNSDASVQRLKGVDRPIVPEQDRLLLVAALECVDYVLAFDEETPVGLITMLRPDVHVKGGDYNPANDRQMPEAQIVRDYGGKVAIVELVRGRGTSLVIQALQRQAADNRL